MDREQRELLDRLRKAAETAVIKRIKIRRHAATPTPRNLAKSDEKQHSPPIEFVCRCKTTLGIPHLCGGRIWSPLL